MTNTFNWTFGELDTLGLIDGSPVVTTIHNVRCIATDADGNEARFIQAVTLDDPDPEAFEDAIPMSEDPEAAQAQRRAWVGEDQIAEWEGRLTAALVGKAERAALSPGRID